MRTPSRPGGPQFLLWALVGAGVYVCLLVAGVIGIVVLRFALLVARLLLSQ